MIGIVAGGALFERLGIKRSLSLSFSIALFGASLLLLYGLEN